MTKIGELMLSLPGKLAGFIAGKGIIKFPLVMRIYGFFYSHEGCAQLFLVVFATVFHGKFAGTSHAILFEAL